jgi:Carboxypeptidase regulatory-like domain
VTDASGEHLDSVHIFDGDPRPILGEHPESMTSKHGPLFVACLLLVGCGGTASPAAPEASTAKLVVSAFTATVENEYTGETTYHLAFHLAETSGHVGATVTAVTFAFEPGADKSPANLGGSFHLAPGGGSDLTPVSLSYAVDRVVATQVSVQVAFTDDTGHTGAATAAASVTHQQRFILSGTVTDSVTAIAIGGAVLFVVDGVSESHYVAADSNGRYSVAGIATGTVTVRTGALGYDEATPSTTVTGDAGFDVHLDPIVALRVTGTAFHVLISERVGSLEFSNIGSAPGSYFVFPGTPQPGDPLSVSAQIDDYPADSGTVTVSIYKHGVLYRTATATGFPSTATASGTF